jgi:hypothetical protein
MEYGIKRDRQEDRQPLRPMHQLPERDKSTPLFANEYWKFPPPEPMPRQRSLILLDPRASAVEIACFLVQSTTAIRHRC